MYGTIFRPLTGGGGIGVDVVTMTVIDSSGVGERIPEGFTDGVKVPEGVASFDSPSTCSPLFIKVKRLLSCTVFPFLPLDRKSVV